MLDTAIVICRAQEAAKRQRKEMNNQASRAILAVKQHRRQQPASQPNLTCSIYQHAQGVDTNHT